MYITPQLASQLVIFTCVIHYNAFHECISFNNWLYHNVFHKMFFQLMAIVFILQYLLFVGR